GHAEPRRRRHRARRQRRGDRRAARDRRLSGAQDPPAATVQHAGAAQDRDARSQFLRHRRRRRAGHRRAADGAPPRGARRGRDDGAHRRALSRLAQGRRREGHRGDQGAEERRHAALRRHQVSPRRRLEGGRMSWPYRIVPGEQTDAAYRGVLLLPPGGEDEYVAGLKLIAEAGLQAQTHAVGDETIDVIVRAYERVNNDRPIRDLRWTTMHLFHPSDAALKKMAALGIWRPCRIIPSSWATTSAAGGATRMPPMPSRSARRSTPAACP